MKLILDKNLGKNYKNNSQKIRVMSESWTEKNIFCPNCGNDVSEYGNNKPVADFFCSSCSEDYELKSKKNSIGRKLMDGGYVTMLERLKSANNPNFFLLNYDKQSYKIINFIVIPKHFFVPEIIIPRNKGLPNRPDYIMCSIDLLNIPESGKIFYIKNRTSIKKENILNNWNKTLFLRDSTKTEPKGWILDIMKCIDKIGEKEFSLQEMYLFENILSQKYPKNRHIKDKMRQQLQFLRDRGYLEFVEKGRYRLK